MRRVSLDEVKEMAQEAKDELWENADAMGFDSPKIILHWTAGWGDQIFDDYHLSITTDGKIYAATENLSDHMEHTWHLNTGTIGVAMCCAVGATTDDLGEEPPTCVQIEMMAQVIAALCDGLCIDINRHNVATHGEAADDTQFYDEEDLYGPQNGCERWDLQFLGTLESPHYISDHEDPRTGGNVLRGKAIFYQQEGV